MQGDAGEATNRKIEVHVEDIVRAGADEVDVLVGMSAGNAGQTEFRRVRVNLREVGVRWEDEFEMALAKAFRREVSVFVAGEGRWPEAAELRPRIEARRFLMIEKPGNASP